MIYNELIGIFWLIFLGYWLVSALGAKKNLHKKSWRKHVWFRILILVMLLLWFRVPLSQKLDLYQETSSFNPIVNSIGVLLCGAGIAFAIWARRHLGRNWGMPMSVKEAPELVMTGPYAYVRHPIYTGIIFAILGSALGSSVVWLIPFIGSCVYFTYSARVEEKIMIEQFPHEYPPYQRRTKMLIPFLF